jgi:hypothetical protein
MQLLEERIQSKHVNVFAKQAKPEQVGAQRPPCDSKHHFRTPSFPVPRDRHGRLQSRYLRRAGFLILPVHRAPDLQMPGVEYFSSTLYFRMGIE